MLDDCDYCGVDNPTCPFCGQSWQDDDHAVDSQGDYLVECDCGAAYVVCADYTVDYSSTPLAYVHYTTPDGEAKDGFCDMESRTYCGADYLPPNGIGRYVYDRLGNRSLVTLDAVHVSER
jgi:hypothetical protein